MDTLDMAKLGFAYTDAGSALGGQPAYPPAVLLKLYLYGYENKTCAEPAMHKFSQE